MKDLIHQIERALVFSDESLELNDYLRDETGLLLTAGDNYYIGLYKPFKDVFLDLSAANINSDSIGVYQYWNGASWVNLPNIIDETRDFSRSGFIRWDFDDDATITESWIENAVNSVSAYWIRISFANGIHGASKGSALGTGSTTVVDLSDEDVANFTIGEYFYSESENDYFLVSAVDTTMGAANITYTPASSGTLPFDDNLSSTVSALGNNIVYSDDNQLLAEVRVINDYLPQGDSSFIAYHVAARDEIVQSLRNGGNVKVITPNTTTGTSSIKKINLTKWDLLDIGEIAQAAKYLALSKIFFDVSENVDDKSYQRFRDYEGMYGSAFKLFYMSLDLDDDGNADNDEELALNDVTVTKV